MRLVLASFKHETNTFSPVPTTLDRFRPVFNPPDPDALAGTNTALGAFIQAAQKEGADFSIPITANAPPSGPVDQAVFDPVSQAILTEVEAGCDAAMLDLHGAMVTRGSEDGEGQLLEAVRATRPGLPIAVALDLHANITPKMIENADIIVGYKTYPHIDMFLTGQHAARLLLGKLKGEINPVMTWGARAMLPHTLKMGTHQSPMKELIRLASQAEAEGALAVSVFGGFPLADIHDAGLSVVTITDADQAKAKMISANILDEAWAKRAEFVYHSEPLGESIKRAKAMDQGPILLIDHSDNCASGGSQDTMAVLAEALDQGLEDLAMFGVCDPESVERCIQVGVGQEIELDLGGKTDLPALGLKGKPLHLTGRVGAVSDGQFTVTGPMNTGITADLGRCVLFKTPQAQIVITEKHHEPYDLGVFTHLGLNPEAKKYVLLKSRVHYRAGFAPIAAEIIECDGEGVTTSDYSLLKFEKVRRPIYPLDNI